MKFVFFFLIFLGWIASLVYSLQRVHNVFAHFPMISRIFIAVYILSFVSLMVSFFLSSFFPVSLVKIVSFWGFSLVIFSLYLFFGIVLIDAVSWLLKIILPTINFSILKLSLFSTLIIGILGVMAFGYVNFKHPKIVQLEIQSSKQQQNKEINIVALSDLHLGAQIDKSQLKSYVQLINSLQPDLVLIAGDIIDRIVNHVVSQKMEEEFQQINSKYGVYAVFGNHEYYGEGIDKVADFYKKATINLLQDTAVLVQDDFYLIGRDDRTNKKRLDLEQIIQNIDTEKPTILLDHQPINTDEAMKNKIDLQLSGHTHNGQFFPVNWIVKKMYENGYGYSQKENTHIYVTSGLGIWGPLYRIGTQSEVVQIKFKY